MRKAPPCPKGKPPLRAVRPRVWEAVSILLGGAAQPGLPGLRAGLLHPTASTHAHVQGAPLPQGRQRWLWRQLRLPRVRQAVKGGPWGKAQGTFAARAPSPPPSPAPRLTAAEDQAPVQVHLAVSFNPSQVNAGRPAAQGPPVPNAGDTTGSPQAITHWKAHGQVAHLLLNWVIYFCCNSL